MYGLCRLASQVASGDYFDHLSSWLQGIQNGHENILLLKVSAHIFTGQSLMHADAFSTKIWLLTFVLPLSKLDLFWVEKLQNLYRMRNTL